MQSLKRGLLLAICVFIAGQMTAHGQRKPGRDSVVLTVSWADGRSAPVKFALKDIEKLERKDYMTVLPPAVNVQGKHDWTGVPLRAVLSASNEKNFSTMRVTALDGFEVNLPASDLDRFDPILAYQKDGQYIGILDKGPLFLIYPFDSHRELQTMEYTNRAIWQATSIVLK